MRATDELRKLLDECGVYHQDYTNLTTWTGAHGENVTAFVSSMDGRLLVKHYTLTPAQAIAATLGGGECEMVTSGTPCEGNTDKACTACGAYNIGEFYNEQSHIAVPNYCPNCGRKVKR